MKNLKIAVIGAGVSGLVSIKVCREYGFDVVCFEKTNDIGGLWRYKPGECEGEASVMKSTIINTSKEMMAFSDYPPQKELPNFMHHTNVLKYFRSYADHFNLLEFIRFNIEVNLVKRSENYDESGEWDITYTDLNTGKLTKETFSGVMMATGHHVQPYCASFPGLDKFKGRVLHSHSYKDHRGYEDKRVAVIGIGNSGGDVAVELGRVASQVYLVTRRGSWCLNRVFYFGLPFDMAMSSRAFRWVVSWIPLLWRRIMEFHLNLRFNHELYGLKCAHRLNSQHPLVNDDLANRIASGTVVVRPNVQKFTETGVIFQDGSAAEDLDAVVLCTGYSIGFPCLEKGLINVDDNRVKLYKFMYVPELKKQTLAIIGCFQPLGGIMPISEMQARLFCEVMIKRVQLPSSEDMLHVIEQYIKALQARYVYSRRHTIQVDFLPFMDDLATMIGAKPRIMNYVFKDPRLAYHLMFDPSVPYQFRLEGPHPWSGAREALINTWHRALYPLKSSRRLPAGDEVRKTNSFFIKFILILCLSIFLVLFLSSYY